MFNQARHIGNDFLFILGLHQAIPAHDYAQPEDAAGTALLLASDAGRYITGSTIMVDGGLSLPG